MRILLILLLTGYCSYACGQTISGVVTDGKTGQRISGAWVYSLKANTVSGMQGEFSIKTGTQDDTLRVKMQGYQLYILPLNKIDNGQVAVMLEPGVVQLNEVHVTALRNRLKDSLNNRKMFAKEFNASPPKLRDILVVSSSPGLLPVAGVTIVPSQFIRALTYKHSREYKFKKVLIRDEQDQYTDSRFNKTLVAGITGLKNDSLLNFMDQYRPSFQQIKKMSDYDIRAYIKNSRQKFRYDTLAQRQLSK